MPPFTRQTFPRPDSDKGKRLEKKRLEERFRRESIKLQAHYYKMRQTQYECEKARQELIAATGGDYPFPEVFDYEPELVDVGNDKPLAIPDVPRTTISQYLFSFFDQNQMCWRAVNHTMNIESEGHTRQHTLQRFIKNQVDVMHKGAGNKNRLLRTRSDLMVRKIESFKMTALSMEMLRQLCWLHHESQAFVLQMLIFWYCECVFNTDTSDATDSADGGDLEESVESTSKFLELHTEEVLKQMPVGKPLIQQKRLHKRTSSELPGTELENVEMKFNFLNNTIIEAKKRNPDYQPKPEVVQELANLKARRETLLNESNDDEQQQDEFAGTGYQPDGY